MATTAVSPALDEYFRRSIHAAGASPDGTGAALEDLWLAHPPGRLHLDLYRGHHAKATVVLQPGVGSYARFYAPLCQALAAAGFNVLGIDRPGHGYSDGARGDCTVSEAVALTGRVIDEARSLFGLPVVLLGTGLGGLLVGAAVLAGLQPDLVIAHNFVLPGRLFSSRLRARLIQRLRSRPYPLARLGIGLKGISADPALVSYFTSQADPLAAWTQSPRAVASVLGHNPVAPPDPTPHLVVLSGSTDTVIPCWISRWSMRWAGLRNVSYVALEGAGHMLFHDHLPQAMAALLPLLANLTSPADTATTATAGSG